MEGPRNPTCDRCKVNPTTKYATGSLSGHVHRSFCDECWPKHTEEMEKMKAEMERYSCSPMGRAEMVIARVRSIQSTKQVPISYAIRKAFGESSLHSSDRSNRAQYRMILLNMFCQDLQIVKARNGYMCNKARVDAIDFKLVFELYFEEIWGK